MVEITSMVIFLCACILGSEACERYYSLYCEPVNTTEDVENNLRRLRLGREKFQNDSEVFASERLPDTTPARKSRYDFVIVGGGSAGSALARRLSEVEGVEVLLLEAGGYENFTMDVPSNAYALQFDRVNWDYRTMPSEKYCLGMNDHVCRWPRGRVVGGSSTINSLLFTRGAKEDYDNWAKMGNAGWSYEEVLPYFKKVEDMKIPGLKGDKKYHNTGGPISVTHAPYNTPVAMSFVESSVEMGSRVNEDPNGKELMGFSYFSMTMTNGTRVSGNRGYLFPMKGRRNLHLSRGSVASRLLFDAWGKKVIGVEFTKKGETIKVYAKKEVIVSAGAIGSPQLLMLSGIGPAEHLKSLGIRVIKDAPVGKNLMDHVTYGGLTFIVDQPVTIRSVDISNDSLPYQADFYLDRYGPMTIPFGTEAAGFVDIDHPTKKDGWPTMELIFHGSSVCSTPFARPGTNLNNETYASLCAGIGEKYAWSIYPFPLRPKSRGHLRLKSTNVKDKPEIYPNSFDDPEDMRLVIKGIRFSIAISKTKAMQRFNSTLYDAILPGCKDIKYDTDEYWECATRNAPFTGYHPCGTCKMGPEGDKTAVVNPRLQVIGVKGLRVIDSSITPLIPSAHTVVPTYMIAEKGADMIKEDWGLKITQAQVSTQSCS